MSRTGNWRWNPSDSQMTTFKEWKSALIGYLVSSREGCNIRRISDCLQEQTGEAVPLQEMGFPFINTFLYEMQDSIEVRKLDGKLFVFIRESAVPEDLRDLRQLVLGQAKDKGCKSKRGVIMRPTKNQSSYARAEELLEPIKHLLNRRPGYVNYRPGPVVPVTNQTYKRPGALVNSYSQPNSRAPQRPAGMTSRNLPPRFAPGKMATSANNIGAVKMQFRPVEKVLRDPRPSERGNSAMPQRVGQAVSASQPYFPTSRTSAASLSSNRFSMNPVATQSSSYMNGKENIANANSSKATLGADDWDDWSNVAMKGNSKMNYSSSKVSAPPRRVPNCIKDLEFDESDVDSDDYDFYAGPYSLSKLSASSKVDFENIQVTISNPLATSAEPRPTPSSSTTSSAASVSKLVPLPKPVMTATSWQRDASYMPVNTPAATTTSSKEPVASTSAFKSAAAPAAVNISAATHSKDILMEQTEAQSDMSASRNDILHSEKLQPHIGLKGDTDEVFIPRHRLPKEPAVRMAFNLPKMQFPSYFPGSFANLTLKAYMLGVSY